MLHHGRRLSKVAILSQSMRRAAHHKQTALVALAYVKWSSKGSAFDSSLWTEARMLSNNKPRRDAITSISVGRCQVSVCGGRG